MSSSNSWTLDSLLEAYKCYQLRARGLRDRTLRGYEQFQHPFLRFALGEDPLDPTRLTPDDVVRFIASLRERFSPRSIKAVRTALRSLFRFLRSEGLCDRRLELSIPVIANWRLATLPRSLTEQQLNQVLASCEAHTRCAYRDRAMMLCFARLGLRPEELSQLHLEDIDWRGGVVRIRTRKTRRGAVLPLPREVGHAIVAYLRRERPETAERRLFVQHLGRRHGEPLSGHTITEAAARALRRARVDSPLKGAYVFRHTVASHLVARGASLKEVADFLGHQCLDTTTIYAKLDLPALREVALPWPEGAP
jgi:integrase/recombinase XerD